MGVLFLRHTEEAAGICRNGGSGNDVMQLSGPSGTIFSPDYPYPYPRDTKCTWVVSVPAGKRVKLTFKDFDLGIGFTQCNYHTGDEDYVAIRDGEYSWSDELVRYCDYNYNMKSVRDVYSTGNHMRITFSSSSSPSSFNTEKGFKASFEVSELCEYHDYLPVHISFIWSITNVILSHDLRLHCVIVDGGDAQINYHA